MKKIQAINGNLDVPHEDWEAREESILYQESKMPGGWNIAAERPDTQLDTHENRDISQLKEEDHEF